MLLASAAPVRSQAGAEVGVTLTILQSSDPDMIFPCHASCKDYGVNNYNSLYCRVPVRSQAGAEVGLTLTILQNIYIYILKKERNILAFFCKRTKCSRVLFRSLQKNVAFFAFFSVLCKRTLRSLRSFPFFAKERCVLCVLFHSLEKNGTFFWVS